MTEKHQPKRYEYPIENGVIDLTKITQRTTFRISESGLNREYVVHLLPDMRRSFAQKFGKSIQPYAIPGILLAIGTPHDEELQGVECILTAGHQSTGEHNRHVRSGLPHVHAVSFGHIEEQERSTTGDAFIIILPAENMPFKADRFPVVPESVTCYSKPGTYIDISFHVHAPFDPDKTQPSQPTRPLPPTPRGDSE